MKAGREICLTAPKKKFRLVIINAISKEEEKFDFDRLPLHEFQRCKRDNSIDEVLVYNDKGECVLPSFKK